MELVCTLLGYLLLTQALDHVTGSDCRMYGAERIHGKALMDHLIKIARLEHFGCLDACINEFHCMSTNLYRHNGSTTCEMNSSTRKLSPRSLVRRSGYEHNEITVAYLVTRVCQKWIHLRGKCRALWSSYRIDHATSGLNFDQWFSHVNIFSCWTRGTQTESGYKCGVLCHLARDDLRSFLT